MKPREMSEAYIATLPASQQRKVMFARNLHTRMTEKGLTQADLARRVGCGEDHMSVWINGRSVPQQENLKKIADALGCDPQQLVQDVGPPPPFTLVQSVTNPALAKLSVNMELPLTLALDVMKLLSQAPSGAAVAAPKRAQK